MAANASLSARLSTAETSHLGVGAAALAIAGLVTASPKVRKALFTREDVFNFHKTLGMSCMISYAYRFSQVGDADMGFGPTVGTLGSIVLHMTLSVSSMIFKIPRKRSLSLYRIWPEYRLHSIVFAWRALLAMLITWAEAKLGLEPQYALNMALVIVCFMASDYASASVGEHVSKSIRRPWRSTSASPSASSRCRRRSRSPSPRLWCCSASSARSPSVPWRSSSPPPACSGSRGRRRPARRRPSRRCSTLIHDAPGNALVLPTKLLTDKLTFVKFELEKTARGSDLFAVLVQCVKTYVVQFVALTDVNHQAEEERNTDTECFNGFVFKIPKMYVAPITSFFNVL